MAAKQTAKAVAQHKQEVMFIQYCRPVCKLGLQRHQLTLWMDSHLVLIVFKLGDHHALDALVPDDGDGAPHLLAEQKILPHRPGSQFNWISADFSTEFSNVFSQIHSNSLKKFNRLESLSCPGKMRFWGLGGSHTSLKSTVLSFIPPIRIQLEVSQSTKLPPQ